MIFELEGDAPRLVRAGDTFSELGGDRIHCHAANPSDAWSRFVVVVACPPDHPVLTIVEPDELDPRTRTPSPFSRAGGVGL